MKCKWVFKKKFLPDGSLDKYKARCTVKGFTQRAGIDFKETFAPTPRADTGRILLALAHRFGWHRRQGDVPAAFLNPDLDVDLYMEMPEGFKEEGHIIRIRKGLYGLKQAAALLYDDVKAFLATQDMFTATTHVCLYTNKERDLFLIIHVDDFQVMGPNLGKIETLMKALHKKYKLKTVEIDLFPGIHISNPDKNTLKLSQGQYARKLLARHGLQNCKSVNSPLERLMEPNSSQCSAQKKAEYNSIIGGLQYLANNTRPDIAHSVNHLARFLVNLADEHLNAAKRVLWYISKEPDKDIAFKTGKDKPILEAYSDADFAGDPETSRSTSGLLIRLASAPVSWKSHLQREVVLSTTEAEYLAATEACRQLKLVKSLLAELGLNDRIEGAECTNLFVDNQSSISLIKNHDNHKRSKHIALRNNYCRQQYQNGAIKMFYFVLQRLNLDVKIDTSSAREHKIGFGEGEVTSLGSTEVNTPLGPISFHVGPLNTLFLLCIQDMKRMSFILENLQNLLIQEQKIVPIVIKFGHPWMYLFQSEQSVAFCHLIESELRRLHRRFGHPSVKRLVGALQRAGHNVESNLVEKLTKYCHQCQLHRKTPGRFKFRLPKEYDFNHTVKVDVLILDSINTLLAVDEATAYQAS
ncbi:hypothetical protein K3495_g5871 [Podosphaera aphanis]|nr:hypothetical protein K3495_g5871 [Podosphaera aphanis]